MQILGHSSQVKILKKLADSRLVSHGYLFFGEDGIGKRLIAESFATYCEFGKFEVSDKLQNDSYIAKKDNEGSIGINEARKIKFFLQSRPNVSPYRIAIINDAHLMTTQAQNALLKVAEEPPTSGVLIFITADRDSILPTLRSRLHGVYFSQMSQEIISKWLSTTLKLPSQKCEVISRLAFGSFARAIEIINQEKSELYKNAQVFLRSSSSERSALIKKIIEPLNFNLVNFLDICIKIIASKETGSEQNYVFWHRILALREEARRGTLNSRIQLMALFK